MRFRPKLTQSFLQVAALTLAFGVGCSGSDGPGGPATAGGGDSSQGGEMSGGSAGQAVVASGGTGGAGGLVSAGGAGGSADTAGSAGTAQGGEENQGPPEHSILVVEYPGRIVEISREGTLLWEHQTPGLTIMAQLLDNDNVFFPHGGGSPGAQEVDRDGQVVWTVTRAATEILGGERLANGNTLLGEQGPPQAVELNPAKSVVQTTPVSTTTQEAHRQVRRLHKLANGNILAALEGESAVREFTPAGATVWEFTGVQNAHDAVRLDNGNTLIGGGLSKRVIEVTPAGEIAWEFNETDGPELGLAWITNVQPLPNGNVLICNWVGADGGEGVHAFEVTPEKEIVWTYDDHDLIKSTTMVTALD